jgi:hypothetical protein
MSRLKLPLGLAIGMIAFFACGKEDEKTYDCSGLTPTYTADIKTVMDNTCALSGCHDAVTKSEGYDLSNYAGVKSAAGNEAFLGSMEHKSSFSAMPQSGSKLSESTLQKIYCWIENGRPQ